MHGIPGQRVFARGHFHGVAGTGEIQVIRFDAARPVILAGIGVHGNEQVGLRFIGDFRAALQRNESVVVAREDHFGAGQFLLNEFSEPQRDIEAQIFLHQSGRSDGPGIVPAVPGIDHDAANLQAQRARQGMLPVQRQVRNGRRPHFGGLVVRRFRSALGFFRPRRMAGQRQVAGIRGVDLGSECGIWNRQRAPHLSARSRCRNSRSGSRFLRSLPDARAVFVAAGLASSPEFVLALEPASAAAERAVAVSFAEGAVDADFVSGLSVSA